MAQFTKNSLTKFCNFGEEFGCEEQLGEEESLRDFVLKQIFSNHLKSEFSFEQYRKNKEKFTSALKQQDLSQCTKGLLNNTTFKRKCVDFEIREILSSCGLEDSEINILVNEEDRLGKATDEAYVRELINLKEKIECRQRRLNNQEDEFFTGVIELNRHEYEEECKKTPSASADKLTRCLVKLKPYSNPCLHPDHPINNLQVLEKQLFPRQNNEVENVDRERKKPKLISDIAPVRKKYFRTKPTTLWDMSEIPVLSHTPADLLNEESLRIGNLEAKDCSQIEIHDTTKKDYSMPFVWPLSPSSLIPEEVINQNKMSQDDIKKDPKFSNYDPGIPSATLYIKNLPSPCPPLCIVSLFGHFESDCSSKVEYRILKGRMKGQAFVKLASKDVAMKAFSLCNGYLLEGRPLVIEYGKSNETAHRSQS